MPKPILLIVYAAIAILVFMAAYVYVLPIFVPFIIALFFTALMEPLIRLIQRRSRMPRGFAVLLTMFVVFGGIGVVFSAIILKLVAELIQLSVSLPGVAAEISLYYQFFIDRVTAFYITLPPGVTSSLEQNISILTANLQSLITRSANSIIAFLSIVPGTFTIMLVSLLATYFLARDRQLIIGLLLRYIPAPWGEKTVAILQEITAAFIGYLRAQAVLVLITIVLSVTGLYLIGADYALTMGLLIGVFDMIPVLGPATIYVPWIIWSFVTGATAFGVKLTILYGLVLVVRQVMEAKIVSANLGLHPLETLLAMYAGLKTIGLAGLILGPIILIGGKAVMKAVRSPQR
ncbi:pheromone autoinducer 2 transporter [Pelotomaculum sp. FP]|uniref:sporulation integral membrane protein YtvI n=1 Tax=Pelotomaculum sp. FP TaxID=261474 RepID=UPI001065A264|nr:sporulation integral membrane protein YtvI [Pelotomaculum sp. FP]TEB16570.1 pheromone autoinducer 2 transporter [Pelotomaculum sp. FP]